MCVCVCVCVWNQGLTEQHDAVEQVEHLGARLVDRGEHVAAVVAREARELVDDGVGGERVEA